MHSLHHVPVAIQERPSSIASSGSYSEVPGPSPFSKPPIKRKCTEKDDTDHPVSEVVNCRKRAGTIASSISKGKYPVSSFVNLNQHVSNQDPHHINDMGLGQSSSDRTCVVVKLKCWEPPEIPTDIDINKIPEKKQYCHQKISL